MSAALAVRLTRASCSWSGLRRAALPVPSRARRLCSRSAVAAAAATGAAPWDAPVVEPPATVPFSADAVNSVAVSGTVLKNPQVYHLAAQQVKAQLRLGLSHLHAPAGAINVEAWGVLALQVAQHVRAGSRIQVRGSLRQDSWLDKTTGERQWMVKVVADELGLLAHHDGEGGHHAEAAAAADAAAHAALQHEQPMPPQPAPPMPAAPQQPVGHYRAAAQYPPAPQQPSPPGGAAAPSFGQAPAGQAQEAQRPRVTFSAEQSRHMYEVEGLSLDAIAARRGIKASTVVDHLLATTAGGGFSSWGRLAAEVGLGPEGGPLLAPAEIAQAIADVEQQYPGTELGKLPLRAIRERLETAPATSPKVAALVGQRGGDPTLLYSCIKLVREALQQGVSFGVLTSGSGQPPF